MSVVSVNLSDLLYRGGERERKEQNVKSAPSAFPVCHAGRIADDPPRPYVMRSSGLKKMKQEKRWIRLIYGSNRLLGNN